MKLNRDYSSVTYLLSREEGQLSPRMAGSQRLKAGELLLGSWYLTQHQHDLREFVADSVLNWDKAAASSTENPYLDLLH